MSTEPCRRWCVLAVLGVVVSMVAGCATLPDPLEVAAGDLLSSGATARLTAEEHGAGHLTSTAASVTVDDATREVAAAARTLAELELTGRRSELRDVLLSEAVTLAGDLHELADAVEAGDDERVAESATELERLDRRLSRLEGRVRSS